VADQDGRLLAERVDKADNIGRELVDVVVFDSCWLVALSVATQIRRNDMIASLGESRELMPPRAPELGEAVEAEHERPVGRPVG